MSNNLNSSYIIFMLTTWMLLCIFFTRNIDAGKGKVPIYMPIPIPIPMPMGPTGVGPKFDHPHQQQQHSEGDGEVKKIYLLQPMPKIQPPPQQKGFMGPVQTHIHMQSPPPIVQHHHQKSRHQQSYGGSHENSHSGGGGHKFQPSYPEMKILPIVVIPPIAPMPPIHVPSSNANSHAPRMTLTPQFNNYVVSSSSEPGSKLPKSNHVSSSLNAYAMDDKSFSDYGLSSSIRRDSMRPRGRSVRAKQSGRQNQAMSQYRSATRLRPDRFEEQRDGEIGDLDDFDTRRLAHQLRGRRIGSANRYKSYQQDQPSNRRNRINNSIRDIIDQSSMFDDDQPYSFEGGESLERPSKQQVDCCNEGSRSRQHASLSNMGEGHLRSNTEQREVSALIDRDYPDQRDPQVRSRYQDAPDEFETKAELRQKQIDSLNNAYYDRDLPDDEQRQPTSLQGGSNYRLDANGKRLYLDERELLDDDQWLFDTVKSVTHVSPNATATNSTGSTIEAPKLNTTTTTNNNKINLKST